MFLLKKLIAALLLPPTGPLLLALGGLWLARRRCRLGLTLTFLGISTLLALSLPVVSTWLTTALCDAQAYDPAAGGEAQAIVVLGGGIRTRAAEYGGRDSPSRLTLERVRYAAYLARRTGLPVAVSGGTVFEGEPEGEVMRRVMEEEFQVPVRWVESASRNTRENAVRAAQLLQPEGIVRILLVAHGIDIRRARREFAAAGFSVTPAPTMIPKPGIENFWDFVPNMGALHGSYLAVYELLGNLEGTLRGLP
jgi:uncharacterized SAM-binding protein YcdF (DUF218 family)